MSVSRSYRGTLQLFLEEADYAALGAALQYNLRYVEPHILAELKRELRDFNAVTGKWKEADDE